MTQEEIDKWVTAYHEAGHAIATHHSRLFELTDPAIRISSAAIGNQAEAGSRGANRQQWTAEHAREFAMISFGGYVGQKVLEELWPGLQTRQEGCDDDYKKMTQTLKNFGIIDEYQDHLSKCVAIIHPRLEELKKLANLIFQSTADVPKAEVLTILGPPIRTP